MGILSPISLPERKDMSDLWRPGWGDNIVNGLSQMANKIWLPFNSASGLTVNTPGSSTFVETTGAAGKLAVKGVNNNASDDDEAFLNIGTSFNPSLVTSFSRFGGKITPKAKTGTNGIVCIGFKVATGGVRDGFVGFRVIEIGGAFRLDVLDITTGGSVRQFAISAGLTQDVDVWIAMWIEGPFAHAFLYSTEHGIPINVSLNATTLSSMTLTKFGVYNDSGVATVGDLTLDIDDMWQDTFPGSFATNQPRETYLEYDSGNPNTVHDYSTIKGLVDAGVQYRESVHDVAGVPSFGADLTLTQLKAISAPTGQFRSIEGRSAFTDGVTQSYLANGSMDVAIPTVVQRIVGINVTARQLA